MRVKKSKLQLFFIIFVILWTSCENELRIIGGRDILPGEFPYVVSLVIRNKESSNDSIFNYHHLCTGAALTSVWVLSAAHCAHPLSFFEKYDKSIRYGRNFPNNAGYLSSIIKFMTHPGYVDSEDTVLRFDVLLIRCIEIKISQYGRINALDYKSLVGHEAFSLGFGDTNLSSYKTPLQVLKGMLYKCSELEIKDITSHMICLLRPCAVEATICSGDSGGPVVHASGIVGVHSMSVDNCNERTRRLQLTPGTSAAIISPVGPAVDWITNNVIGKFFN